MKEPDWRKMYLKLAGALDDALEMLTGEVCDPMAVHGCLLQAVLDAEEIYLESTETGDLETPGQEKDADFG